jgi:CheY-like chemotaxis protein
MTKPVRQVQLHDVLVAAFAGNAPAPRRTEGGTAATHVLRGMRVLVVEDNPVNLRVALRFLDKLGCACVAAGNGAEALEQVAAAATPFDVVLMDVQMPVLDGYQATRELRRLESVQGMRRLPVIALTANAFEDDQQRCYAAGMDAYLSKPYTLPQLAAALAPWQTKAAA